MVPTEYYLILSAVLFATLLIVAFRKNPRAARTA